MSQPNPYQEELATYMAQSVDPDTHPTDWVSLAIAVDAWFSAQTLDEEQALFDAIHHLVEEAEGMFYQGETPQGDQLREVAAKVRETYRALAKAHSASQRRDVQVAEHNVRAVQARLEKACQDMCVSGATGDIRTALQDLAWNRQALKDAKGES